MTTAPPFDYATQAEADRAMLGAWIDLSPYAEALIAEGTRRLKLKNRLDSTRYWTHPSIKEPIPTHVIGLLGEALYLLAHGCDPLILCRRTKLAAHSGDKGTDFLLPTGARIDVKTATNPDPVLKFRAADPWRAEVYALCHVNLDTLQGRYLGWATRPELQTAPLHDYGHGRCHALHYSLLHKTLLPRRPA